jgi:anti-sigma regulatory factor (Ser/Thr protein kinase)
MKIARTFTPDGPSITAARRFVMAAIGDITPEQRDVISVMVSELAMNAVEHARTPFEVIVEVTGRTLRVEVTDSGGGTAQAQPLPPATSLHGRGLFIVEQLSDAWGVTPSPAGPSKSVWFTIALSAAAHTSPRQSAATEPGVARHLVLLRHIGAVMAEQVAGLAAERLAEPGQGAEPDRPGVAVLQDRQVDHADADPLG